ncbi:DUF2306 domain-containing protein [Prosthecobacter dejongeii]|uniref:Uncharacterized protein n=1 Tax=Prosthecobacter dejongeii TaxID=48465 RepID=A0A7W7YNL0_9BACT|nr:DUF2306 domain-containing protein [Prosthecobacter dejongeii]MBB5039473.1 hypothetical protein [Prosthecobacter dejongeii]
MPTKPKFATIFTILRFAALAWFTWLMLRITLEYFPIRDDAAFLQIKQQYLGIQLWRTAFWIHVFTSMLALLAGFTQFFPTVLRRMPQIHRWMGRAYMINVCFITGPASLVMAFYANGGWSSRLAFILLAVSWMFTSALGWRTALQRDWTRHREWMLRSYALTLSAITLRVWKYSLVFLFEPRPMDLYRMVAWLGFVPNLLLVEWLIYRESTARLRP